MGSPLTSTEEVAPKALLGLLAGLSQSLNYTEKPLIAVTFIFWIAQQADTCYCYPWLWNWCGFLATTWAIHLHMAMPLFTFGIFALSLSRSLSLSLSLLRTIHLRHNCCITFHSDRESYNQQHTVPSLFSRALCIASLVSWLSTLRTVLLDLLEIP